MRVAAFTGGPTVPSGRFRVRQFIAPLAAEGIAMTEMGHGGGGVYPPAQRWKRPLWAAARLAALAPQVAASRRYDAVLLQREFLSSLATLEGLTGRPRLFDVDDSIHLLRGGGFARTIASRCDRIIAGNDYLAQWYRQWNRDVRVLPTCVDTDRYAPARRGADGRVTMGWIGTSANFPYLQAIEPALRRALDGNPDLSLSIMADRAPVLASIDPSCWQFQPWSEAAEVGMIQSLDLGLMPLPDDDWTRGKCSFKMLQYMACSVPVVVSPVGMNVEVLAHGESGLAARSADEWTEALLALATAPDLRHRMGMKGRAVVEMHYSVRSAAPKLADILRGN
jgi:glycosyltransferase involved in cell wall biosynthesis